MIIYAHLFLSCLESLKFLMSTDINVSVYILHPIGRFGFGTQEIASLFNSVSLIETDLSNKIVLNAHVI